MSLNKKSDVKNHLSTRRSKTLLAFRPTNQSDVIDSSGNELRDKNLNVPDSRQNSSLEPFPKIRPITPVDILIGSGSPVNTLVVKKPQE
jgi:hypothetical protein